jgi:hypothetical protein
VFGREDSILSAERSEKRAVSEAAKFICSDCIYGLIGKITAVRAGVANQQKIVAM